MHPFRPLLLVSLTGLLGFVSATAANHAAEKATRATVPSSRLVSVTGRSRIDANAQQVVIVTCETDSPRRVLIRSVGRGLPAAGDTHALPTPVLMLLQDEHVLAQDHGSAIAPDMADLARIAGAFPIAPSGPVAFANYGSALAPRLERGDYTLISSSGDRGTGNVWFELHDIDPAASAPLVRRISLRGQTGPGDGVMILGFNISGDAPLRLLLRGVVPRTAATFATDAPAKPQVELFGSRGSVPIIHETQARVRSHSTATKPDTIVTQTLTVLPGSYTALIRAAGNALSPATLEIHVLE